MKYRVDFVTNSSSSSYVCEICGHEDSGFDLSLSDLGFCECENGHIICDNCYDDNELEKILEKVKEDFVNKLKNEEFYNVDSESILNKVKKCKSIYELKYIIEKDLYKYGEIPSCLCPICQNIAVSNSDLNNYKNVLLKKSDKTLKGEMLKKFETYDELNDFLRKEMAKIENQN